MPMVVMNEGVQASSQKRSNKHDFPTPVFVLISSSSHAISKYLTLYEPESPMSKSWISVRMSVIIKLDLLGNGLCACLDKKVVMRGRHGGQREVKFEG